MDYTYRIEESADGFAWDLAPEGGPVEPTGDVPGDENADDMAAFIARNQSCATGDLWRVRVWTGAGADTSAPAAGTYTHDTRTPA